MEKYVMKLKDLLFRINKLTVQRAEKRQQHSGKENRPEVCVSPQEDAFQLTLAENKLTTMDHFKPKLQLPLRQGSATP